MMAPMPARPPTFRFVDICTTLTTAARALGLVPPSFRSPPGVAGAVRSIRRRGVDDAVVSVAHRGRPWPVVVADLVEGIVVANGLSGAAALRARSALWAAVEAHLAGSDAA
jgi:hypothetical protein